MTHHRSRVRPTVAGIAALALAATVTPAAVADVDRAGAEPRSTASATGTLVYIKDHDVWLARGDGTGARALTTDGTATRPYTSPTQSDRGVVVAGRLGELVRMDQSGRVLNRMDPRPLPSSVSGHPIDGNIQSAAISPDGSLIAYSMAKLLNPPGAEPGYRYATGYTAASSYTPPGTRGTTFFDEPSWVSGSRTLQSGGFGSQVMIDDLDQDEPVHWFDDEDVVGDLDSTDLGNAEVSPDGRYLAAVRGLGDQSFVWWYRVEGDVRSATPPAVPTALCEIGPTRITDPTWAPDSDSLAWAEADGIWVRAGAEDCSQPSRLLIPGGSEPDWSPAPLDPPKQPSAQQIKNRARPDVTGRPRVGRVLMASAGRWSPTSVRITFQWRRNGKVIRGADARRYRVARQDRGRRLSVTVTASRSGWKPATASSRQLRVRR